MALSFTRPDPSSPSAVASAAFTTSRKGFEPSEVREFLRMVAAELARLQEREKVLELELRTIQRDAPAPTIALDEETVTRLLGDEAVRILHSAREAAAQIKTRAEEGAARLLRDASDEAQRLRTEADLEVSRRRADAASDAEDELEMAKQQGRDMVHEARAYRERVLAELARRREAARQQIEQLIHGRDRLLQAFERSRAVAVDVMAELTPLAEPTEYVDLSPTTGPIPIIVPHQPPPGAVDTTHVDPPADSPEPDSTEPEPVAAGALVTDPAAGKADAVHLQLVSHEAASESGVGQITRTLDGDELPPDDVITDGTADEPADVTDAVADDGTDESTDASTDVAANATVPLSAVDADTGVAVGDTMPLAAAGAGEVANADEPASAPFADEPGPDEETAIDLASEHDATTASPRGTVDDLFARLRAARAEDVVERAVRATPPTRLPVDDRTADATVGDPPVDATGSATQAPTDDAVHATTPAQPAAAADDRPAGDLAGDDLPVADRPPADLAADLPADGPASDRADDPADDSVFLATPDAPSTVTSIPDTPFAHRDAALTPVIVAAARKLKRVLADEQNGVLHSLRRKEAARSIDAVLPPDADHTARYVAAIEAELTAAAVAGAVSMGVTEEAAARDVERAEAVAPAARALGADLVEPLRSRVARSVADADGDNTELAHLVRVVYREWKSQRIDEHLDDVVRTAFGRGALAAAGDGSRIRWIVDPNGPACPDAEDNALAGPVESGHPFPTDHVCAPAHRGCTCMIVPVRE
jgi:DivIVA domain-containing protein